MEIPPYPPDDETYYITFKLIEGHIQIQHGPFYWNTAMIDKANLLNNSSVTNIDIRSATEIEPR